ncbi:leucine-rich repeat receptor-like serine/threonine-protein kinase At1g17230 [Capsicum annuum]|uniref:leucine-rich repeat receptor-like serine/threonine-protein kinase At1g17230 n=1 Tax=Capsicum annuum TaxID=4072 RepID=UPI001FB0DA26|nr:leucine-rich repeat receptor-like serine/threonine-protein kinase At1g17230 [Capsicum annuum]
MALTGRITREFGNPTFLVSLDLERNNFQGNLPQEMARLHRLRFLDLSFNKFRGEVPSWIEFIAFTANSLSGYLPNGLCNGLPILKGLYLSTNKLRGHMPTSLPNSLIQILSLSENESDGPIHSEIGRLSNMQKLALGTNHFTVLAMEKNQITGSVPISIFNISSLQILSAWQNNLIGEIPKEISNLIELEELVLADNSLSGSLDTEIINISGLRIIDLSSNNLSGSLPPNLGSILPNIERLFLGSLTNFVGTIPHSISNCSKLSILDLSDNKLTGLIPNSLGYLTHLQYLNLEGNNLTSDSLLSLLTSLTN